MDGKRGIEGITDQLLLIISIDPCISAASGDNDSLFMIMML